MFNPSAPMDAGQWNQWYAANQQAGQAAGAEGTRRFDAELKARKYQVDQQYRAAMLQAKTERERIEVQRWYNEQQVRIADEALAENARQYDKTFGLNEGELTGWYGGSPTLARQRQEEEQRVIRERLGLETAGVTGYFGGAPTLERERQMRELGFTQAGLTGYLDGATTLERERFGEAQRQFNVGATGYIGTPGQLTQEQRARMLQIQQADAQLRAAGQPGVSAADQAELAGYQNILSGAAGPRQATLERERFGLETARIAAEMRSRPDMLFQYQQFAQNLPSWLGGPGPGTASGGPSESWAGAGGRVVPGTAGGPQGQTIPGQLAELGYLSAAIPPGGPTTANNPVLAAIGQQYQRGFRSLGAQALESMDPNERGFLASGGTFLGYDPEREARSYQRSRLGQ